MKNKNEKIVFVSPGVFTTEGSEQLHGPQVLLCDLQQMTLKFPNDQELGRELRKFVNEFYENQQEKI